MTDFEKLSLKLKLCELAMAQVNLELRYNGKMHLEVEDILHMTQENILILGKDIIEVCKDA